MPDPAAATPSTAADSDRATPLYRAAASNSAVARLRHPSDQKYPLPRTSLARQGQTDFGGPHFVDRRNALEQ